MKQRFPDKNIHQRNDYYPQDSGNPAFHPLRFHLIEKKNIHRLEWIDQQTYKPMK